MKILTRLMRLPAFLFILGCILFSVSCKKTGFLHAPVTTTPGFSTAGGDFEKNFFIPATAVDKRIQNCIDLLKLENEKHHFVDALPKHLGRPLWEKMQLRNLQTSQAKGDPGTHFMVVAFAPTGYYVSGLLIAVPVDTGYATSYYSKEYLNVVCHKSNKDIADAENLLGLFMLMENSIFNRTDFYHIPTDLFPTNARVPLTDSTKIASMISLPGDNMQAPCVLVPSGAHHYMEEGTCDWYLNCPVCSAMYCGGNPPGPYEPPVPGGPGGPSGNPPGTPGGGGGGSGGGNPPAPAPVPCDGPFYLINPCDDPPGPIPPIYELTADDIRIINQLDAEDAEVDAILSSPATSCEGTKRSGNINFRGTKEHWLIQLDYISRNSVYGDREYAIPQSSPNGNTGYADLINKQTNEIFEIKPDNDTGFTRGLIEVQRYVMKANQFCPTAVGSLPPNWRPGENYSLMVFPSTDPTKFLQSRKAAPGVLLYKYISKTSSPQPLPVTIPVSIMDKLRYLIDRLRNNINDFDRIIAQYMRQHPELVNYLKSAAIGAAVAIVVGTILEDIATLGGGILDDWASFVLAYRIVRFAWAL
jgi:hypothetical protein